MINPRRNSFDNSLPMSPALPLGALRQPRYRPGTGLMPGAGRPSPPGSSPLAWQITVMNSAGDKVEERGHITGRRVIPTPLASTADRAAEPWLTSTGLTPFLCYCCADFASRISHPHIQADSSTNLTARTQAKHNKKPTQNVQPRTRPKPSPNPTIARYTNEKPR